MLLLTLAMDVGDVQAFFQLEEHHSVLQVKSITEKQTHTHITV